MSGKRITDETMMQALTQTKDIAGASEYLGISRQAIYNRMRKPEFRQRLREQRQDKYQVANTKLTDAMNDAIETLVTIMNDTETSAGIRVKASQTILDICLKTTEQMDILERISQIEQTLAINK